MYHICFSNPTAWDISYKTGVYGNVQTGNDKPHTFWGKLIDLLALKSGDKIFFYVKKRMALSGLFEVVSEPYFCQNNHFRDKEECYPFRFNFKEIKRFVNPIPSSELAKLIENGKLHTIPTFEKDANAPFRSIRQITKEEGELIEELFLKFNPKVNFAAVTSYKHIKPSVSVEAETIISNSMAGKKLLRPTLIKFTSVPTKQNRGLFIGRYENALQGYIYYCLRRGLNNVIDAIEVRNFSECLMEVPMLKAQQFRSDILCLYREAENQPHFYTIIETKRDKIISIQDLAQLMGYMKTFAESKGIPFNCIEGVYISIAFEEEAIQYLRNRKKVENENPVRLIKYNATADGAVKFKGVEI